ncbi:hypothetical protein SAMN04488025_10344 [Planifilum fulgidum]|jgi:hypothetical protein|uniref:Uncharacterized protein n=1 Tax=Planifilum fulgidum TaxID=201973 RepID=A0A1I2KZ68_9BACL|nr:EYxxD motif small membrane protein [Planifilum fulgidum]SFF70477.1 hypothetical protein SAMN04488025_10344 [Planifilum fulgidum]
MDPGPVISEILTDYGFVILMVIGALVVLGLVADRFRRRQPR